MKIIYFWIAIWAFLGGLCRYGISLLLPITDFPIATLFVNLTGAFLLILVNEWAKRSISTSLAFYKGLSVGFVGSYTTFSTFSFENLTFLQTGQFFYFVLYSFSSLLGGLLMSFLAYSYTEKARKKLEAGDQK